MREKKLLLLDVVGAILGELLNSSMSFFSSLLSFSGM